MRYLLLSYVFQLTNRLWCFTLCIFNTCSIFYGWTDIFAGLYVLLDGWFDQAFKWHGWHRWNLWSGWRRWSVVPFRHRECQLLYFTTNILCKNLLYKCIKVLIEQKWQLRTAKGVHSEDALFYWILFFFKVHTVYDMGKLWWQILARLIIVKTK